MGGEDWGEENRNDINQLFIATNQAPKPPILGALTGSFTGSTSPRIGGRGAVRQGVRFRLIELILGKAEK